MPALRGSVTSFAIQQRAILRWDLVHVQVCLSESMLAVVPPSHIQSVTAPAKTKNTFSLQPLFKCRPIHYLHTITRLADVLFLDSGHVCLSHYELSNMLFPCPFLSTIVIFLTGTDNCKPWPIE